MDNILQKIDLKYVKYIKLCELKRRYDEQCSKVYELLNKVYKDKPLSKQMTTQSELISNYSESVKNINSINILTENKVKLKNDPKYVNLVNLCNLMKSYEEQCAKINKKLTKICKEYALPMIIQDNIENFNEKSINEIKKNHQNEVKSVNHSLSELCRSIVKEFAKSKELVKRVNRQISLIESSINEHKDFQDDILDDCNSIESILEELTSIDFSSIQNKKSNESQLDYEECKDQSSSNYIYLLWNLMSEGLIFWSVKLVLQEVIKVLLSPLTNGVIEM